MPQYEMSRREYRMSRTTKTMTKTTMNTPLFTLTRPKSPVKIAKRRMDDPTPPMTCQGLNRPKREVVLSTKFPSSGSMKISAIRIMKTRAVMIAIIALASESS